MPETSFAHYFQTELTYFRELAQEFAHAHPEVAHLVSERGGDPAAERLFQGASLLTARLRQRIEDDLPEIAHPLFDRLWPQHLRPQPPVTLIRFSPLAHALRQAQPILPGAVVKSRGEKECHFRVCYPSTLYPLVIEAAALERPHPADLQLRLRLRLTGGASFDAVPIRSLTLQLLGERETQFALYGWLIGHATGASLRAPDGEVCLRLPRSALRPIGLRPGEALYPALSTPIPNLHLLQEYFLFVDKFLGVELEGLDRAAAGKLTDSFDLVLHLGDLPETMLPVSVDNFALGCVPAINLAEGVRIDIPVSPGTSRYRLSAPRGEVFTVDRVRIYDARRSDWVDYAPFGGPSAAPGNALRHLVERRVESALGAQAYLVIVDEAGRPRPPDADQIQVWLSHTDGVAAHHLGVGEIDQPTESSPEYASFANLTPVIPGSELRIGRDRLWQRLAEYAAHPRELASMHGLRLLLEESATGRPGEVIPEIVDLQREAASRLHQRTVVPLRRLTIVVREDAFVGEGQMLLFASVLSKLFQRPPNSLLFTEVTVRGERTGVSHRFAPE
jgi:type VI secretion system protein ImpG